MSGSVTSKRYVNEVMTKFKADINGRTKEDGKLTERRMFPAGTKFIYEQDHARCHDANFSQDWCRENWPDFLNREDTPSKMDNVWAIERLWGIMTAQVYAKGQPKNIKQLRRRIKKAWSEIEPKTVWKLIHQMKLRVAAIAANGGQKLKNFKMHCTCKICNEMRD